MRAVIGRHRVSAPPALRAAAVNAEAPRNAGSSAPREHWQRRAQRHPDRRDGGHAGCASDALPIQSPHTPLHASLIGGHVHAQNTVYVVVHTPRRSAAHGHATCTCLRHASRGVNDPHKTGAGPPARASPGSFAPRLALHHRRRGVQTGGKRAARFRRWCPQLVAWSTGCAQRLLAAVKIQTARVVPGLLIIEDNLRGS